MKYIPRIFTHTYFLYAILLIMLLTVLGYIADKKYDAIFIMLATGIIIKQFNNNMSIILFAAVVVGALYSYVQLSMRENMAGFRSRYKKRQVEQFENDKQDDNEDDEDDDEDDRESQANTRPSNGGRRNQHRRPQHSRVSHDPKDPRTIKHNQRAAQYNALKGKYNDLIHTIRSKTQRIKEMARKIKENA